MVEYNEAEINKVFCFVVFIFKIHRIKKIELIMNHDNFDKVPFEVFYKVT